MQVIEQGALTIRIDSGDAGAGTATLHLAGELDLISAPALVRALTLARDGGCTKAVLACADLVYLDSSGVSALLQGNSLLGGDRALRLTALSPAVRRILEVLAIDQVLDIDPPVEGADAEP